MLGRLLFALAAIAAIAIIFASWPERMTASASSTPREVTSESVFSDILPKGNALIPMLDDAYRDLEFAMRPHGCAGCHAPELDDGGHRARVRHAVMLLDNRRSIEAMVDAKMMPPETDEHAAGIADEVQRARLLYRVRAFRALGDAALASW
jgi:hypothetical protein